MALTDQLARSGPYLERLLDDDYVHENLADAARRGRDAYARAAGRPARKAAADKRLQRSLRDGAASLREVILALQGKRRARRRHRGIRALALIAAGGGAAAVVISKRRDDSSFATVQQSPGDPVNAT
jgi:hypothetical protein